jgi:hypothetical protein
MIDWNKLTKDDDAIITKIAKRGIALLKENKMRGSFSDLSMDISAAHINSPLNLEKLLAFDDANFGHDVFGIRRFINRDTGELTQYFSPR